MSKAAISIFAFAIYLLVLGAVLVTVPNVLLSLFRLPETDEVWVRVVGMLVLILAYYYIVVARNELTQLMRATVVARSSVLLFFLGFVVLAGAPPMLLLFGVVDLAAASWTGLALRSSSDGRESRETVG